MAVTVYALNQLQSTTDAFLGSPVPSLGREYVVMSYEHTVASSQVTVVGTVDGTTVTVTPSFTAGARVAGTPFDVTLDEGQTYQLRTSSSGDYPTGTRVVADQPVAVFGGARSANVPVGHGYCDYMVEQLPATATWGTSFAAMPLWPRDGATGRVLADVDDTQVRFDGAVVATLATGDVYEQVRTDPSTSPPPSRCSWRSVPTDRATTASPATPS